MLPSETYFITQVEYFAPKSDHHHPSAATDYHHHPDSTTPKSHHSSLYGSKKLPLQSSGAGGGGLQGQRTRFTVRELIKIFEVTSANPCKKNKNQVYW
jgi:hypothetical protein